MPSTEPVRPQIPSPDVEAVVSQEIPKRAFSASCEELVHEIIIPAMD